MLDYYIYLVFEEEIFWNIISNIDVFSNRKTLEYASRSPPIVV